MSGWAAAARPSLHLPLTSCWCPSIQGQMDATNKTSALQIDVFLSFWRTLHVPAETKPRLPPPPLRTEVLPVVSFIHFNIFNIQLTGTAWNQCVQAVWRVCSRLPVLLQLCISDLHLTLLLLARLQGPGEERRSFNTKQGP